MVRTITIGIHENVLESKLDPSHLSLKVSAAGVSEGEALQNPMQTYTIKSANPVINILFHLEIHHFMECSGKEN